MQREDPAMYAVTAYASWLDVERHEPAFHLTTATRSSAFALRESSDCPIVDVRDIGTAGHCPGGNVGTLPPPIIVGHRFTAAREPRECLACGAWESDLYVPGTYLPAEPMIVEEVAM